MYGILEWRLDSSKNYSSAKNHLCKEKCGPLQKGIVGTQFSRKLTELGSGPRPTKWTQPRKTHEPGKKAVGSTLKVHTGGSGKFKAGPHTS